MSRIDEDDPQAYSFLERAAEEARFRSRRHWAKGGYYDRRYPVQGDQGLRDDKGPRGEVNMDDAG